MTMNCFPFSEQGAFILGLQRVTDKDFLFKVYQPAARPAVVEFGITAGSVGPDVSFEWQSLRGSWVPNTPERGIVIFYSPMVQTFIDMLAYGMR